MILFDHLELAERSNNHPLKILKEKLEYTSKEEGLRFIDINNYPLDVTKINRALVLSFPDLDQKLDDLIETSEILLKIFLIN